MLPTRHKTFLFNDALLLLDWVWVLLSFGSLDVFTYRVGVLIIALTGFVDFKNWQHFLWSFAKITWKLLKIPLSIFLQKFREFILFRIKLHIILFTQIYFPTRAKFPNFFTVEHYLPTLFSMYCLTLGYCIIWLDFQSDYYWSWQHCIAWTFHIMYIHI